MCEEHKGCDATSGKGWGRPGDAKEPGEGPCGQGVAITKVRTEALGLLMDEKEGHVAGAE